MTRALVVGSIGLLLTACASAPSNHDAASDGAIKPSYSEKIGTVRLEDMKGGVSCPHDSNFEKEEWRRQVAFANACVKVKDWIHAERIANSLAVHAPTTPWGPYFLALVASSRKDFPRAQWMLELALKKAPNEGLFHFELGRLKWEMNDEAAALAEMKLASDANPSLIEAHLVIGQMSLQKGNLGEARKYLTRALAVDPHHGPSLLSMADVEMKAGNWTAAESLLNQCVSVYPRLLKIRLSLAQVQEQHLKKATEALANYRTLKKLSTDSKMAESLQGLNLEDKIQSLEKSLSQSSHGNGSQGTDRKPSTERIAR